MKIDHKTAEDIMDELKPKQMRDGDVTVKMIAESWGKTEAYARRKLNEQVKDEVLEKFMISRDGKEINVYRAVEQD